MAPDKEPFTCITFVPPPDEAPLVEIKQLLNYILRVVNDFHLAIVALLDTYPLADALDTISELREEMSKQFKELEKAFTVVASCARIYSTIPNEVVNKRQEAEGHIRFLVLRTEILVTRFRDIDAGVTLGAQYFRGVVAKIGSILADIEPGPLETDGPRTFLSNTKNPKVAENLLQVFVRVAGASVELAGYYHTFNKHMQDLDSSVETLHPSAEEVQVIEKLWNEHHQHTYRFSLDLVDITLLMRKSEPYISSSEPPYQSTLTEPPPPPSTGTPSSQSSPPVAQSSEGQPSLRPSPPTAKPEDPLPVEPSGLASSPTNVPPIKLSLLQRLRPPPKMLRREEPTLLPPSDKNRSQDQRDPGVHSRIADPG
ncbi:hypothetical protein P691DRAFT_789056 [Macrolepiota fuliginosa MF-IS2]|uniref:Uncharacterized protein n=1 Tax=Macrolepiota fuliginosa MF-IS2 TaxID=1400762 RepID=A0A9P6BYQ0_9AGAR|nr:hypothetical protein P691DRAFT_789056 [Macrolepiota fuliginosa MF-IS2]